MYDPDELEEESQERRRRQLLNKTFKKYVEQVPNSASLRSLCSPPFSRRYPLFTSHLCCAAIIRTLSRVQVQEIVSRVRNGFHEFDIPSRDISFSGAPSKETVLLLPCTTCLVSLTDRPVRSCSCFVFVRVRDGLSPPVSVALDVMMLQSFTYSPCSWLSALVCLCLYPRVLLSQPFVLSLDDIEHVHFERVHFSSKSFDMVVIMKAGTVPKGAEEFTRISAIPMAKLDTVKMWLTDVLGKVSLFACDCLRPSVHTCFCLCLSARVSVCLCFCQFM